MLLFFIRFLLRLLYRLEVVGTLERAPRTLVIANHASFLDAAILWSILPRETLWVVHSQIERIAAFRFLMRAAEYIVIDSTNPFSLKNTVEAIEAGRPVAIFPEGRVSVTGTLMKIYEGPAFIAAKSGATVVPVIIRGAVHARGFSRVKNGFTLHWFPKITVRIFPGVVIPMPAAGSGKQRRQKTGEEMRRILQRHFFLAQPQRSLHEAFLEAVEFYGRGRAMVEDSGGTTMTYGVLLKASLALGRLVDKFTHEGEVVGVMLPNAAATMALLLGMLGRRRTPAMLNFTSGAEGMQSACRAARVKTIITSRAFLERGKLGPTVERLRGVEIVCLEDLRARLTLGDKLWLMLYALRRPRAATLRSRPEEAAAVLFTSGSEGKPKGVVLSHWSILANVEQAFACEDVTSMDRMFSAMPVFHSFGLMTGFFLPIVKGMPVFLYPTPLHYNIIPELVYDRDSTILFATPTFLKHYARRANAYDFRRMRLIVAGAERLTAEVRDTYLEKFGIRVIEGYGATECAPIIAANSFMRTKFGSVGELFPAMEARLEPVTGISEGGLLHVRGPNMMLGYWRESNPGVLEPPQSIFGPGWYATGDLARFDEDGFLYLLGRVKRFAKIAGEMISLELVENIAARASPAAQHAAVSLPDARRGEMIVLCTLDAGLRREHLQQAAQELGAPEMAVARRVVKVAAIPLLGTGKRNYPKLTEMAEALLAQPST